MVDETHFTGLEVGVFEDSNNALIGGILSATATLDFASTAASTSTDLTITVTGAADGDTVLVAPPDGSTLAGGVFSGWVSAADTVTVRFTNETAGALDPASGTFRATVLQFN